MMPQTAAATAQTPPSPQSKGWSPERRAKHAAAVRIWAPWAKSTGPRTAAGKARSSQNALKHGGRDCYTRFLYAALARHSRFLRNVDQHIGLMKKNLPNELLNERERLLKNQGLEALATLLFAFELVKIDDRPRYQAANDG